MQGDADNKAFAAGAYGACGEYSYYDAAAPMQGSVLFQGAGVDTGVGSGLVRAVQWQGWCGQDQKCMECQPGDFQGSGAAADGRTCLNGKTYSAADVDGTARTFGHSSVAGTQMGLLAVICLLIGVLGAHMYAESARWRVDHGYPPMTCCECFCCCGACANKPKGMQGPGAESATTKNPAAAVDWKGAAGAPGAAPAGQA